MSARVEDRDDWMTALAASKVLGISHVSVPLVKGIRIKGIPGMKPKYCRADIERVARESVTVSGDGSSSLQAATERGTLSTGNAKSHPGKGGSKRVPDNAGPSPKPTAGNLNDPLSRQGESSRAVKSNR